MKAMQLKNIRPVETKPLVFCDIAVPKISEDEILIRIKACGICHTDLHIIEGDLPQKKSPLIPGHQIVGVVEQKSYTISNFNVGDRVGVPWLYSACGVCEFCRRGEENLCNDAKFTGYDVNGGYAEYMVVNEKFAYHIPKVFSDEQAAPLMCAGIIGYRALRLSRIEKGGKLGLYGFGASAHITIQVARHMNCEVYVFSRSKQHRKHAEELGAVWAGTTDEKPPVALDSIISFAPVGEIVPKALSVLRKGGTLALAGIYVSPIPQFDYNLLYHEKTIRSVANSTRKDAKDFLKVAAEIPVKIEVKVFSLEEANRALDLVKGSLVRGAAVVKNR